MNAIFRTNMGSGASKEDPELLALKVIIIGGGYGGTAVGTIFIQTHSEPGKHKTHKL